MNKKTLRSETKGFQTTLYIWFTKSEENAEIKEAKTTKPIESSGPNQKLLLKEAFPQIRDAISNYELEMRHDKNGNVIGWMEGESKTDEWDGSLDNQIKNLEDHVSRRGWTF